MIDLLIGLSPLLVILVYQIYQLIKLIGIKEFLKGVSIGVVITLWFLWWVSC
jgi:sorbitol-specific phosphotransferase system component IIC